MTLGSSGLGAMVVRGRQEADLEAVLQEHVAEPLEGAVLAVDLDKALEFAVALRPVSRGVRVRDDQDVSRVVGGAKPLPQQRQPMRFLDRHPLAVGAAEEHVVVAAAFAGRGPFVAQEGDRPARLRGAAAELLQLLPLVVVEPEVMLREGQEVEARVLYTVAEVPRRRSLALGEAGVAVGFSPQDPALGLGFDPDRVARGLKRAVGRTDHEAVGPGLLDRQPAGDGDGAFGLRDLSYDFAVQEDLVAGQGAAGAVQAGVLAANRQVEGLARPPPPTGPALSRPPQRPRSPSGSATLGVSQLPLP